jgi:hypothetical protein
MPADLRRLSILTAQEIDDLYGLPRALPRMTGAFIST